MCIRDRPKAILTDNGTQFTSKKWVNGLKELNIQPKYTAIRNPCANLAKRINRQLGNLFRIFVHDQHTKWSQYVRTIEACINEVYHETIEITPHEAHLGKRPTRAWGKCLDKEVIDIKGSFNSNIFVKIKEKREKHAKRSNESKKITKFATGDKVLIRTYYQSDGTLKKIDKFFELFSGPYKVNRILGDATYELVDCDNNNKVRGKFNIWQIKKYYAQAEKVQVTQGCRSNIDS